MQQIALAVDLEFWWNNEFLTKYLPEQKEDQIQEAVSPLLALLKKHNAKATFFVVGLVAEKHPDVVRSIHEKGMEVGCHGYSHKMLDKMTAAEFEEEIGKTAAILESITGERPIGFRAPSFSINNKTKWAMPILQKYNFKYDASVFPIRTNIYGLTNTPLTPYKPDFRDLTREDPEGAIIEFPMSIANFGIKIPVTGGFYFRLFPYWFIEKSVNYVISKRPVICYIHPWETFKNTPRIKGLPPLSRFVANYGINTCFSKLEKLLTRFNTTTIRSVLNL